ncbi:MAG: thioredoxin family protein [Bacteroidetes bacterium]|nr:thioredoxin family protein [Bacteroidota bacterium]
MKRIVAFVFIVITAFTASAQEITFAHESFAALSARAQKENKLIFIDFYTSWCGPCRHMAQTVFKEDTVGRYFNSHFINLKVDAEKGEGRALAAKYRIELYPTYIFADARGAVFNKAIGNCSDTLFLGYAATALQQFTDPNSLPRLQQQYEAGEKDTAFLHLYLDKLVTARLPAFEVSEKYLRAQTTLRPDSRAMMEYIIKYPLQQYYGGIAAEALKQYGDRFRQMADSAERRKLELAGNMLFFNSRKYAEEKGSEVLLKRCIAEWERMPAYDRSSYTREGLWLSFYAGAGKWNEYKDAANRWLDSISLTLKYIPPPAGTGNKPFYMQQTPETAAMRRMAGLVSDNAKIYLLHFPAEPGVAQKALRWTTAAAIANPSNPFTLTLYANLLYENGDTSNAIINKTKALNNFPPNSLHRNIVQTNLTHMQHGEALEEE